MNSAEATKYDRSQFEVFPESRDGILTKRRKLKG